jgi:hypothetical protein
MQALAAFLLLASVAAAQQGTFLVKFNEAGIASLKRAGDKYDTEYITPGRTLGHVITRYRMGDNDWKEFSTTDPAQKRQPLRGGPADGAQQLLLIYNQSGWNDYYADLELTERFRVEGDSLYWSIHFRNPTHKPVELGDVALPLPFHTEKRYDKTISTTLRVVEHRFISGHNSFLYWLRPNGEGPFLVMTPVRDCPLFESTNAERDFTPAFLEYFDRGSVYIHSALSGARAAKQGGTWRKPQTSVTLSPRFSRNGRITYAFRFRWAPDYDGVRQILYEEGLLDVQVVPGMTVPLGLEAQISVRTRSAIRAVEPEHPAQTQIESGPSAVKDTRIYKVRFSRLGENKLTVRFGKNQYTALEFFVTEPVAALIKKRAAFLTASQQHRDPAKWYNGLFSEWDMRRRVLRSPEDTGGLLDYIVASDDPGLCKAPFIAAKNVEYPEAKEIEAVEYYLKNYVWGKLQQTEEEKYPYAVYGIDNWKVNRESKPTDRNGWVDHVWRPFDYPHVVHLYWNMYRVAKFYPDLVRYLDKDGYLQRAYGTARAYYTVPYAVARWSTNEVGHYDELVIRDLIAELYAVGWKDKAEDLKARWEAKVEHFVNDRPNLFLSEYPFDPTGFESHHAFAKYAVEQAGRKDASLKVTPEAAADFMKEEMAGNLATRGWLETSYWQLGVEGSMRYMSQMGGWSVLDYALYHAPDPFPYLRLGYASILSSWALMNTGTPESNYGYWYPGPENDGAAGSAYMAAAYGRSWIGVEQPRGAWPYSAEIDLGFGGALRSAATIVAQDPIFGWIAYGGRLSKAGAGFAVIPQDGVLRRFHAIAGGRRLHLTMERDGFAPEQPIRFTPDLQEVSFTLASRTAQEHETELKTSPGYQALVDGRAQSKILLGPRPEVAVVLRRQ